MSSRTGLLGRCSWPWTAMTRRGQVSRRAQVQSGWSDRLLWVSTLGISSSAVLARGARLGPTVRKSLDRTPGPAPLGPAHLQQTPSTLHPCHLPSFFCWMGRMDGPSPPSSGESSLSHRRAWTGQASEVPSARSPALRLYTGTFLEPATWVNPGQDTSHTEG